MKLFRLPVISDLPSVRHQRVIVRGSFDVPIENGVVTNYFRVMRAMPTLLHLTHGGAKVILITHIGRDPQESLEPLYTVLKDHLDITYVPAVLGSEVDRAIESLEWGKVLLLGNIRSIEGEINNDPLLGKKLASYGDLYVNDAFAVSHRAHASIVGIPKYLPSYAGLTFYEEYMRLIRLTEPNDPSLFILGGAKFETKQPLVEKYLEKYNHVFVGGALANDFFKAKGYEVGVSKVSDEDLKGDPIVNHKKILLPVDVTVEGENGIRVTKPDMVEKHESILDAGPETITMLKKYTKGAKTILWNGPLGNYEGGFVDATRECAKLVAESDAYSVIGGGDTIAAIESLAINDKFSFVSTAGGAMLCFLEESTLPGIKAILASSSAPK